MKWKSWHTNSFFGNVKSYFEQADLCLRPEPHSISGDQFNFWASKSLRGCWKGPLAKKALSKCWHCQNWVDPLPPPVITKRPYKPEAQWSRGAMLQHQEAAADVLLPCFAPIRSTPV